MEHKVSLCLVTEDSTDVIGLLIVPKLPWQAILRFYKHHLVSIPVTLRLTAASGCCSMKDMESGTMLDVPSLQKYSCQYRILAQYHRLDDSGLR
jgi:hypothetical protein